MNVFQRSANCQNLNAFKGIKIITKIENNFSLNDFLLSYISVEMRKEEESNRNNNIFWKIFRNEEDMDEEGGGITGLHPF